MGVTIASLLAETLEPGPAPARPLALGRAGGRRDGVAVGLDRAVGAEEAGMIDEIAEIEPFAPFRRWLDEAWQGEPNAHAMILATTTSEGRPSARAVLLKGLDDRGFVFYTNLESRKSKELLDQPSRRAVLSCGSR